MALKPTIYKFKIALSDMDRDVYDSLQLTVAQHPSETIERMMVRVLAYCINAQDNMLFTKGLSAPDEPDIQVNALDGRIQCWIDVGEPAAARIKKATRIAQQVKVYSFNSKSDVWWQQEQAQFADLAAQVFQLPWQGVQQLARLAQRTMDFSVTITEGTAFFSTADGDCEIAWRTLQGSTES